MQDILGPQTMLGYCTNVHSGLGLEATLAYLNRYSLEVKRRVSPDKPMGIGLWLSALTLTELRHSPQRHLEMGHWLASRGLVPFTFNGFPYDEFHDVVVKKRVYEPSWANPQRMQYTRRLLLQPAVWRQEPCETSISTLPIGWAGTTKPNHQVLVQAAANLARLTELMTGLRETGTDVHLDLEPEPGAVLQRAADVPWFFKEYLLPAAAAIGVSEASVRRHIRVCHDICHAAVMFEEQADVLARYREAGIKVGKVQISSAIAVPFDTLPPSDRMAAIAELGRFAEDRYLHQTCIRKADGTVVFFEDLPLALASVPSGTLPQGHWRIHFHVPVFLERFGLIQTTQPQIAQCLSALRAEDQVHHFEVETYAWGVLPAELRVTDLAEGIARELQWVIDRKFTVGRR